MKNYLKTEIKYGIYSKLYLKTLVLMCVLICGFQYLHYSEIMYVEHDYNRKVKSYDGNLEAMYEDIEAEYSIDIREDGSMGVIENPIAYYKAMLDKYVNYAHPQNALAQIEEIFSGISMVVFSVFGALYIAKDDKYRIKKLKTIRMSKFTYIKYKQISMIVSAFIIMIAGFIFGIISNIVYYSIIKTKVDMNIIEIEKPIIDIKTEIIRILIVVLVMLVFLEIGAFLATIFKSSTMSVCIMCAYLFVLQINVKYGLSQCIQYLYDKFFDLNGVVSVNLAYNNYNIGIVLAIMLSVLVVSVVGSIFIENKRSSFEAVN